jgi:hypothetical protein
LDAGRPGAGYKKAAKIAKAVESDVEEVTEVVDRRG